LHREGPTRSDASKGRKRANSGQRLRLVGHVWSDGRNGVEAICCDPPRKALI
jgi:hypothetical protein